VGIFDELNKTMKQAQNELKKASIDRQLKDLEQDLSETGKDLSKDAGKIRTSTNQPAGQPASQPLQAQPSPTAGSRIPHKGYGKITTWVKKRYSSRIAGISDPHQMKLELEQITNEACNGLPVKTKKGFLDYLKTQNLEQLLK
jgi:hypothetical protein